MWISSTLAATGRRYNFTRSTNRRNIGMETLGEKSSMDFWLVFDGKLNYLNCHHIVKLENEKGREYYAYQQFSQHTIGQMEWPASSPDII